MTTANIDPQTADFIDTLRRIVDHLSPADQLAQVRGWRGYRLERKRIEGKYWRPSDEHELAAYEALVAELEAKANP